MDHLRPNYSSAWLRTRKIRSREYKREAFELFKQMLEALKQLRKKKMMSILCRVQVQTADVDAIEETAASGGSRTDPLYSHEESNALAEDDSSEAEGARQLNSMSVM